MMKGLHFSLLLGLVAGCLAPNEQSVVIVEEKVPEIDSDCVVRDGSPYISRGTYDAGLSSLGLGDGYILYPYVRNLLIGRTGANPATTNVILEGAEVELVPDAALAPYIPADRRRFAVRSCGCQLEADNARSMTIRVIPPDLPLNNYFTQPPASLPEVVARVRVIATRAGVRIPSAWVEFPVRVCSFCLAANDPASACPVNRNNVQQGSCNVVQDISITCCTDPNRGVLCGSNAPTT